jgi:hypothetical protein
VSAVRVQILWTNVPASQVAGVEQESWLQEFLSWNCPAEQSSQIASAVVVQA